MNIDICAHHIDQPSRDVLDRNRSYRDLLEHVFYGYG